MYFDVIRPDCKLDFPDHCGLHHECIENGNNTTSVLRLNSQAYLEASEVLQAHENFILLGGTRRSVFRNMKAFGKPGRFVSSMREYKALVPPRYCELQFLRFRKVAIGIQVSVTAALQPEQDEDFVASCGKLAEQVSQIRAAILKGHHLGTLRVIINRAYKAYTVEFEYEERRWEPHSLGDANNDVRDHRVNNTMKNILTPMLEAAYSRGVAIGAEEETLFRSASRRGRLMKYDEPIGDPLVAWITSAMPQEQQKTFNFDFRLDTNEKVWDIASWSWLTVYFPPDRQTKRTKPAHCKIEEEQRFDKTYNVIPEATAFYQLLPECRTCYTLFSGREELKEHLEAEAKHTTSHRPKEWNEIHTDATYGGWVKCHTCAFIPPSQTVTGLETHYRNQPWHQRHGMVPRWKEDNGWWNSNHSMHPRIGISFRWTERQKRLNEKYLKSSGGAEDAYYL